MNRGIFVLFICCALMAGKLFGQELSARFVTDPPTHTDLLTLPNNATKFATASSLKQAINEQLEHLQLKGYLGVRTTERTIVDQRSQSVLEVVFDLGPKWEDVIFYYHSSLDPYIDSVSKAASGFESLEILNDSIIESQPQSNDRFQKFNYAKIAVPEIPNFLSTLSNTVAKDFSPFSEIQFSDLQPLVFPKISAKLQTRLLPQRKIDSMVIKGYTDVDRGLLKHKAGLKFPLEFNQETIRKAEEALLSSPYINLQRQSETLFEDDKTTLYMYLQKKEANQIEGILGFGSDTERSSLKLNGYLDIQLWNNLNKSEQFDLRYKADGNQQERLEIRAALPYVAQSPFGIQALFELFRKDSTFTTVTTGAQITYKPLGFFDLSLGYTSIESTKGFEIETIQSNLADYRQGLWGLEAKLEKLSSHILMPRKYLFKMQTELGSINEKNILASSGSNTPLINARKRINLELNYLLNLWPSHYLWIYHKTALINGDNLRVNELYRFGGTQSLRGFNENLIETSQLHLIQSEYRLSFSEAFYIHHLTDLAFYQNQSNGRMLNNYSVGLGIGAITRAGILKLQLAQGFGERTDFSNNNTKIHVVFNSQF